MDLDRAVNAQRRGTRESQVWDAVAGYHYYAPRILAFNEEHERLLAEAALYATLEKGEAPTGRSRLTDRVRHRLGSLLILLGTSLQVPEAGQTTVPAASEPRPAA